MKRLVRNINLLLLSCLFIIGTFLSGCTKGGELVTLNGPTYTVLGPADGTQMVPASATTATCTFNGWYDEQVDVLTFTLAWSNIWTGSAKDVITSVNFYAPANKGESGTQIHTIKFTNSNASGSINLALSGYNQLLPAERDAFYAGKCYYMICTQNYPAGLIRGQLTATKN